MSRVECVVSYPSLDRRLLLVLVLVISTTVPPCRGLIIAAIPPSRIPGLEKVNTTTPSSTPRHWRCRGPESLGEACRFCRMDEILSPIGVDYYIILSPRSFFVDIYETLNSE